MATMRQKAVVAKIVENGGNVSKAMREVGYSPATAQDPSKVTQSIGFRELMEEYLPDTLLQEKHKEFLLAPKLIRRFRKGELEEEVTETDSNAVRALDMAYKLKGLYKNNSDATTNNTLVINLSPEASARYAPSIAPVNAQSVAPSTLQSEVPIDILSVDVVDITEKKGERVQE